MHEYRVELESFSGPMDLLLHLVREQEVDICDVSISLLLRGYLSYLEKIQEIDLNEATDFLVMASSLLEIKSKELLPREEVDIDQVLDPRDDLVAQLLEYRRFKDLSSQLGDRWVDRSKMFGKARSERVEGESKEDEDPLAELDDLDAWDILKLYASLVDQVGENRQYRIHREKRPIQFYIKSLLDYLKKNHTATFSELFEAAQGKEALVGSFVALLELVKVGFAQCNQESVLGPIVVEWFGPQECSVEDVITGSVEKTEEEDPAE